MKKENSESIDILVLSEEFRDEGYSSSEEYSMITGIEIPEDIIGSFYSDESKGLDVSDMSLFMLGKEAINNTIDQFFIDHLYSFDEISDTSHNADFYKPYIVISEYIAEHLLEGENCSASLDLFRYIEQYVYNNFLPVELVSIISNDKHISNERISSYFCEPVQDECSTLECNECDNVLGDVACSNEDGGSFCSAKCANKSYQRNHGGKTDYYNIPEWVTDLDTLAEAWNLSHYEFNVLKGVFGASRIRQGLDGRHSASNDDKERDLNKTIHYSKMMLKAFNRSK